LKPIEVERFPFVSEAKEAKKTKIKNKNTSQVIKNYPSFKYSLLHFFQILLLFSNTS